MERRKIQLTGGSTYAVSLPKKWVVDSGIRKNDYVGIVPRGDGTLLITPSVERPKEVREKSFHVPEETKGNHVMRKLIGAYVTGYSLIEVKMSPRLSTDVRSAVRKFSQLTIGTEIIEESANSMVIRDLLNPTDLPFEKSTRRMYYITRRMLSDSIQAFADEDEALALDVISRDVEVDRLNWLMTRQYHLTTKDPTLAEKLGTPTKIGLNYILISRLLERIADHSCSICISVKDLEKIVVPDRIRKDIARLGGESVDVLDKSVEAFFGKDIDFLNDVIDLGGRMIARCDKSAERVSRWGEEGAVALGYILESIRRSCSYSRNIAEVAINYLVDISR